MTVTVHKFTPESLRPENTRRLVATGSFDILTLAALVMKDLAQRLRRLGVEAIG
jgi:hypothetical protein